MVLFSTDKRWSNIDIALSFHLGGYGFLTDNWSIGVILFTMIAQRQPFREGRQDGLGKQTPTLIIESWFTPLLVELLIVTCNLADDYTSYHEGLLKFSLINDYLILEFLKQVLEFNYTFEPENLWEVVSEDGKDMVRKLLVHFTQRLTSSQILEHPWMQDAKVIRKANRLVQAQYSITNEAHQMKRSLSPLTSAQENGSSDIPKEIKGLCSKRVRITKENGELNL